MALLVSACGGGSSGSAPPTGGVSPTPSPTPAPTASACSLRSRQDWALAQLQEWYLFPDLFNAAVNPSSHGSVESYIDALVAPARAQSRDRYFTYLTSIAEENAYYEQGETAGFGIRFGLDSGALRLFVTEAFEGGPGLAAGIDRGAEITHIGTSPSTLQSVASLLAGGGTQALVNALGPDTAGTARTLTFETPGAGTRTVTVSKTEFALDPVSDRYGARIIADGARRVGYVNLRTFIDTADPALRDAFAQFRAQGVTELIVDLRYNGGGLISIAELMGDLMGEGRAGQIFEYVTFRSSKASENESYAFQPKPQSIAPTRIAFIGTGGTASASEMVINGFVPYLGTDMALIGGNTYGKPVGQIALDRPGCDDRLRAVALKIENADREGEYYTGLASTVPVTCRAFDDISRQLGDPQEAMIAVALDFLAGRGCTAISASTARVPRGEEHIPLTPEIPRTTMQRELPGAY
jgi:carboxyl-terminal processing protease